MHLDNKNNLTDTVVMLRPSFQISERWRFNPTLAYGVSGDSDTTYSMMPQLQYQFSDSFAARFGYKKAALRIRRRRSEQRNRLERSVPRRGLDVPGASGESRRRTAAAASGREARTGRCSRTGEMSRCRPRWRMRCGRPVSEYACRRARRTRRLRLRLRAAHALRIRLGRADCRRQSADRPDGDPVLKNPKVALHRRRTVIGYTDNVGKPDYNLALSKRRAQAVADYVKSQGVNLGDRFQVSGNGEAEPIADNKTEEGRAQNRRVVIRRTDCGPAMI